MPADDLSLWYPDYLVATHPSLALVAMVRAAAQRPPLHPATCRICRRVYPLAHCLRPPNVFLLCRTTDSLCHRGTRAHPRPTSRPRQRNSLAPAIARPVGHHRRLLLSRLRHSHVRLLLPHPLRLHHPRLLVRVADVDGELAITNQALGSSQRNETHS